MLDGRVFQITISLQKNTETGYPLEKIINFYYGNPSYVGLFPELRDLCADYIDFLKEQGLLVSEKQISEHERDSKIELTSNYYAYPHTGSRPLVHVSVVGSIEYFVPRGDFWGIGDEYLVSINFTDKALKQIPVERVQVYFEALAKKYHATLSFCQHYHPKTR